MPRQLFQKQKLVPVLLFALLIYMSIRPADSSLSRYVSSSKTRITSTINKTNFKQSAGIRFQFYFSGESKPQEEILGNGSEDIIVEVEGTPITITSGPVTIVSGEYTCHLRSPFRRLSGTVNIEHTATYLGRKDDIEEGQYEVVQQAIIQKFTGS
ncbi:MAG: hypothetical protein AAF206_00680 [Bacteroidota bacterium]